MTLPHTPRESDRSAGGGRCALAFLAGAGPAVAGTFMVNADPAAGTGCDLFSPNGGLNSVLLRLRRLRRIERRVRVPQR